MGMNNVVNKWKCMTCEDIANFKGLCRDCTTYGDGGEIIEAIRRVRLDKYGNEYQPTQLKPRKLTHEMMVNERRANHKITKRQRTQLQEQIKIQFEAMKNSVEVSEDGLMEFGEVVEHVHGPGCSHDEEE
jgi:hypothetical protein